MSNSGFMIYLVGDNQKYKIGLSKFPELDVKHYLEQGILKENYKLFLLTSELSLLVADYIYRKIKNPKNEWQHFNSDFLGLRLFKYFIKLNNLGGVIEEKKEKLKSLLAKFNLVDKLLLQEIKQEEINRVVLASREELTQIYHLINGRKLYKTEIIKLVRKREELTNNLNQTLEQLRLTNKLSLVPAVRYQEEKLTCQRCGGSNIEKINCNYCFGEDYYCKDCNILGEARGCRSLYLIPGDNQLSFQSIQLQLDFKLTKLQQDVSQQLVDFLSEPEQEIMLWAVCGAGKTEVSFNVIVECLAQGGKVLFAIPRKDVVIELADRLTEAFPEIKIKALYSGTDQRYQEADLVIATTHQLIRYYRAFDLVILDEMDAFPYQGSAMLKRALQQAKKKRGNLIYMTATPKQSQLESNLTVIKLAARYHGYPLPEPELIKGNLEYNQENRELYLAEEVIDKLKLSVEQDLAQVFLFVPTKDLVKVVTEFLAPRFPVVNGQSWVQGSHSGDNNREEKRESFAAGEYPILVSTTIMERGITVKKANVLVLFADREFVFNEQTLVQMAGRSGRSVEYPKGRVWFVGEEISQSMQVAKQQISVLNQEAKKKGYLKAVQSNE